jgi:hypothetical protein
VGSKVESFEPRIFSVSKTGRFIMDKIDGKKTLGAIIEELTVRFNASRNEIEQDVFTFMGELKRQNIICNIDGE